MIIETVLKIIVVDNQINLYSNQQRLFNRYILKGNIYMAWEPWTGCYKISDGCTYCYYYGLYSKHYGHNKVYKTSDFYKPLETVYMPRKKIEKYKMEGGKICNTCFTTE